MSEAPERIWAACDNLGTRWDCLDFYPDEMKSTEYLRADLAGLPEGLVERLTISHEELSAAHPSEFAFQIDVAKLLLRDILAWHEQQRGGGDE